VEEEVRSAAEVAGHVAGAHRPVPGRRMPAARPPAALPGLALLTSVQFVCVCTAVLL
jgi:hypothetical protein